MVISDNIAARDELWIIGDTFVKDSFNALTALKRATIMGGKQPIPYLFNYYDITGHHMKSSANTRGLARFINPLVNAMNEEPYLPKIILIIPDKNFLMCLKPGKFDSSMLISSALHYTIKQIDKYIDRRQQDLFFKKPGTAPADGTPKIILVRMPKRPSTILISGTEFFSLRGKFNSILKECLLDGNAADHYIISIDIDSSEYDLTGEMTSAGKANFWKEINKGIKKFDDGEISLRPRGFKLQTTAKDVH